MSAYRILRLAGRPAAGAQRRKSEDASVVRARMLLRSLQDGRRRAFDGKLVKFKAA